MRARVLGGVLVGVLCACHDRERSRSSPGMLVATEPLEFGTVGVHRTRELQIGLVNVGRGPIVVHEVSTLGPIDTFRANLVTPPPHPLSNGDECRVRVRYTPHEEGQHRGTLRVRTDSADVPIFEVDIRGEGLLAEAVIRPERLDFGRIEIGSEKQLALLLRNPSALAVAVRPKPVGADRDELHLSEPAVVLEPGGERELDVTFAPTRAGRKLFALAVEPCEGCLDRIVHVEAEGLEQAVVARPPVLDFGAVPIDRDKTEVVTLVNLSTEPMQLTGFSLDPGTDLSFTGPQDAFPIALRGGESRAFQLRYSPGHMGLATGMARFSVTSRRHPTTDVELRAFGGSSELCVSPATHDFGEKPVGSKNTLMLHVKNCGTSNAAPLTVRSVVVSPMSPDASQFSVVPPPMPRTLGAGEELVVKVFYEPTRPGPASAVIDVHSTANAGTLVRATVAGRARLYPPCDLVFTPPAIDFGTVPPGRGAVLGVKLTNRGASLCAVKNIHLSDDAGGSFRLPGGGRDGHIFPAGGYGTIQVAFVAPEGESGPFRGTLHVEAADPANPIRQVALTANVQGICLVPRPRYVEFGLVRPSCPPSPASVVFENGCGAPVTVNRVFIGPGTTDGEFELAALSPPVPVVLSPGASVSADVVYKAAVPGMNISPLFADVPGLAAPILVPLLGEMSTRGTHTDTFIQQDGSKVDVLFVIDNTASMVEEHPRLQDALPAFAQAALSRGVNLHVAITTTGIEPASSACPGGAEGGEAGRLFPADNSASRLLTHLTPNLGQALKANAQVGRCAFVEKGLEAVRFALSPPLVDSADDPRTSLPNDGNGGFLRVDAPLAVVFVGDEDDHSPDTVEAYVRAFQSRTQGRTTIYAIAPQGSGCSTAGGDGTRYAEAAQRTGGEVMSICASDYRPLLENVAQKAFSPQERFSLTYPPDPATIAVAVDGAPVTAGWTYDPAANQVVFAPPPRAGARIAISYSRACAR